MFVARDRSRLSYRKTLVTVVVLVFVAAACADDDAGDARSGPAATTTGSVSATTQAATTTGAPTTTSAVPTTTTTIGPQDDALAGLRVVRGLPYRQPSDGSTASTVDVYLNDAVGDRPAVVLLHGWGPSGSVGPDLDLAPLAEAIARLGSTVFYFGWDTNGGYSADSASDLRCIGGFVSARAAEYGSNPDNVVVIGHSMGGESGSMLALSSFGLAPTPDCVETGEGPAPYAFLGIAGAYGMVAQPLDDDLNTFRVRAQPVDTIREVASTDFVAPGLTALQAYALDGYSALPSPNALRVVLLVGTKDQYSATNASITAAFAEALKTYGTDVEVVEVPDGYHGTVILPNTDAGQATLQIIRDILDNTP